MAIAPITAPMIAPIGKSDFSWLESGSVPVELWELNEWFSLPEHVASVDPLEV